MILAIFIGNLEYDGEFSIYQNVHISDKENAWCLGNEIQKPLAVVI